MAYIIKNNLPSIPKYKQKEVKQDAQEAEHDFWQWVQLLSAYHQTKVYYRNSPLRAQAQVQIDGFYYWIELYKEK